MTEYNKDNRFPFHTKERCASICFDDHEDIYELDFIYGKIVDKFPALEAGPFYARVQKIQKMKSDDKLALMKENCDGLLKNIKECISDEAFIHQMHDRWGFGIDRVIETLYAVYGYYFYTGKRTANVIKKTIDGYKKRPVH